MKKVYLSGGLVSNWQEEVVDAVPMAIFYNPKDFSLGGIPRPDSRIYAPMDRLKIDECDIVFGYLEASNPTPINVIAECSYGKGRGKTIIFCNEWIEKNIQLGMLKATSFKDGEGRTWFKPHYFDLVSHWFDFVETDLGRAIDILREIVT